MTVKSFRDLRVWRAAVDVVESVYRLTQGFPKQEAYGLTSQIRRAAISIPSNIAEGHTREHNKEFLHHLSVAQASLAELETQLEIAKRLEYITSEELSQVLQQLSSVGRQLYALRNSLLSKHADS
ncbi:MAG: four helix bundle protein [bacterium]